MEDEGAKKKWDAWRCEQGLLTTEAKRRYIAFLIETMRMYVGGSVDGLELLNELEFMWDQIKNIHTSDVLDQTAAQLPPWSPLSSQFYASERFSTRTPSIAASNKLHNRSHHNYSHSRLPSQIKHEGNQNPFFKTGLDLSSSQIQPRSQGYDATTYSPVTHKLPGVSDARARKDEFDQIWAKVINTNHPPNAERDNYNAGLSRKLRYLMVLVRRKIKLVAKTMLVSTLIILLILWWLRNNAGLRTSLTSVATPATGSSKSRISFALDLTIDSAQNRILFRVLQLLNGLVKIVY